MSHFSVLVIGEDVDEQLAPYHEFECTGQDDQYVQNVDLLAEARAEYESQTRLMLRAPDGTLVDPYGDEFYREPTWGEQQEIPFMIGTGSSNGVSWTTKDWGDGLGRRVKVHFVPEGYEEVRVQRATVQSFAEFVEGWYGLECVGPHEPPRLEEEHKYGWYRVDQDDNVTEVIKRTNPNAKWDWYSIGGRWSGYFKLKPHAWEGSLGEPGVFELLADEDERAELAVQRVVERRADQARKKDIDFLTMRNEAAQKAAEKYDAVQSVIAGRSVRTWDEVRESCEGDIDRARREYQGQPVIQDLIQAGHSWIIFEGLESYLGSREEYIRLARESAVSTFAVVKDGVWHEKGEMGWFAIVSNEKEQRPWNREFSEMLDSLPGDTLLTLVDCHI